MSAFSSRGVVDGADAADGVEFEVGGVALGAVP